MYVEKTVPVALLEFSFFIVIEIAWFVFFNPL